MENFLKIKIKNNIINYDTNVLKNLDLILKLIINRKFNVYENNLNFLNIF